MPISDVLSRFFFFANHSLLAAYFIFILDYRNVRPKAKLSDFLIYIQNGS